MFTDMMVDLETTGTHPEACAIIQLAAVKFNLLTREVCPDVFDKGLAFAPNRYWEEGGRAFWQKMPDIYNSIVARAEDPGKVLMEFRDYAMIDAPPGGYRFWSKPQSFDWSFVASYYRQYGIEMPFHYRTAMDLNSYVRGLRGDPEHIDLEELVPFEGPKHDAKWDCFGQINQLFYAQDKWGPHPMKIEDAPPIVFET